jgi:16S rRNA (uracil1498-N3)-methyltransferase
MIRLCVSDPLAEGARVNPAPEQSRYLMSVMRLGVGDSLLLFNGRDGEWRCAVELAGKRDCILRVEAQTRPQMATPDLELVIALVKRGPLETIVEKATELGVRRIRLVTTRRTNADHARLDRLQAIATEAAEQTGRLDVPQVLAPMKLDALLADWPAERRLMFCDEAGDNPDAAWGGEVGRALPALTPLKNAAQHEVQQSAAFSPTHTPPWAVLIGPEGGFAAEERDALRRLDFVTPVTLGPRILRADTAAIAALTLWQAALGDWR